MPRMGVPICRHTEMVYDRINIEDSYCPDHYWLIKIVKTKSWKPPKRLIECKKCGKQRWTTTQWMVDCLKLKPKKRRLTGDKANG